MFKKILITTIIILSILFSLVAISAPSVLGFSVWNLGHAIQVSTSMSAKLACSAKYVTGLSEVQITEDLSSYSPVANLVDVEYDDANQRVSVNLFGLSPISAQYHSGVGCSLIMDGFESPISLKIENKSLNSESWPAGTSVDSIKPDLQRVLDNVLLQDNEAGFKTRSLIVLHDGKIVAESYSPEINETTPLLGWSMGKSFTAIMLARMQQLGMVSLSQSDLFPEIWQDERKHLTLEHLLQMSSGLAFDETYAPGSDATHMLFTAPSASDVALTSSLIHTPGEHFSYSSGTTNLLSRFAHEQLGGSTQLSLDFLYHQIFVPLGMTNSTFETDSSGVFVGSSYLYASARDWARLGLLMLNNGRVGEQQFIPSDWVKQASKPNGSTNDKRYGYQFWLNSGGEESELRWPSLPEDAYAMMGNHDQSVMIIPSRNVVLVRLGWTTQGYPMEDNYYQLLKQVKRGNNNG